MASQSSRDAPSATSAASPQPDEGAKWRAMFRDGQDRDSADAYSRVAPLMVSDYLYGSVLDMADCREHVLRRQLYMPVNQRASGRKLCVLVLTDDMLRALGHVTSEEKDALFREGANGKPFQTVLKGSPGIGQTEFDLLSRLLQACAVTLHSARSGHFDANATMGLAKKTCALQHELEQFCLLRDSGTRLIGTVGSLSTLVMSADFVTFNPKLAVWKASEEPKCVLKVVVAAAVPGMHPVPKDDPIPYSIFTSCMLVANRVLNMVCDEIGLSRLMVVPVMIFVPPLPAPGSSQETTILRSRRASDMLRVSTKMAVDYGMVHELRMRTRGVDYSMRYLECEANGTRTSRVRFLLPVRVSDDSVEITYDTVMSVWSGKDVLHAKGALMVSAPCVERPTLNPADRQSWPFVTRKDAQTAMTARDGAVVHFGWPARESRGASVYTLAHWDAADPFPLHGVVELDRHTNSRGAAAIAIPESSTPPSTPHPSEPVVDTHATSGTEATGTAASAASGTSASTSSPSISAATAPATAGGTSASTSSAVSPEEAPSISATTAPAESRVREQGTTDAPRPLSPAAERSSSMEASPPRATRANAKDVVVVDLDDSPATATTAGGMVGEVVPADLIRIPVLNSGLKRSALKQSWKPIVLCVRHVSQTQFPLQDDVKNALAGRRARQL